MPRKKKIPSYRLHKSSGQAVVTLAGHDHYLGVHGTPESQQAYARLIALWTAGGGVPTLRAADSTVAELLAGYWSYAVGYYVKDGQPTSQLDRVKRALAPVRSLYGDTSASSFGPVALSAVRDWMVRQGWCRRVVNQRVDCVKRCWKWGCARELVPATCYQALRALEGLRRGRTPAPESVPVLPAPEEAISAALLLLSPVLADAARFQLLTACRPGEALALRACDLDRSRDVWLYRPRSGGKTAHHERGGVTVLVGPKAQELLARWLLLAGAGGYVFSPKVSVRLWRERQRAQRKTPVQPSQQDRSTGKPKKAPGEKYRETSYARAVAKACAKAGCAHWHPHQLRHNSATRLREEFGIEVARLILGHRHLSTTELYAAVDLEKALAAVRKVG